MHNNVTSSHGFTLVEMIVSLAIFAIVVTISVGALLVLVGTNQRLQGEQGVMANLSFTLDSMTREIRTGTKYYCVSDVSPAGVFNPTSDIDIILAQSTQDCSQGNSNKRRFHGVAFIEGGDSLTGGKNRVMYFFDSTEKMLYRKIGDESPEPLISGGLNLLEVDFFVTGTNTLQVNGVGSDVQPTVSIFIQASEEGVGKKPFHLQTTVTSRILDV
jgi:prepilin-type N-terminal cleavage/methylation domain-containing protein